MHECSWLYLELCNLVAILGELEERMAELEDSRRKLVNLKLQKDGPSVTHAPKVLKSLIL